jgi:hypothetical protein
MDRRARLLCCWVSRPYQTPGSRQAGCDWLCDWSAECVLRQCCKRAPTKTRARAAGHNYIGTEHILMGLLREGEGVAARVLETLGADQAKIRTQARSVLCSPPCCSSCCLPPHTAAVDLAL